MLVSSADWAADATATENPVTVAAITPPAAMPTITGCTCALRMRGPVRCLRGTNIRYGRYIRRGMPRLYTAMPPLLLHYYPTVRNLITKKPGPLTAPEAPEALWHKGLLR